MNDENRRVWSSDGGRVPEEKATEPALAGGKVRIVRESKGRRGKTVTVVRGLGLAPAELAELAGELKKSCGVGGTAKNGEITIQGDKQEIVTAELKKRGYPAG